MRDGMSVEVTGLKELQKQMTSLGPKIALKALRSSLAAGARVVKKEAMSKAPVKTGSLRNAIFVKVLTKTNPSKLKIIIGVRNGRKTWRKNEAGEIDKSRDAYYWRFIEFGHKDKSGSSISARPFIAPALETKRQAAIDRIKTVLADKISKIVKGTV